MNAEYQEIRTTYDEKRSVLWGVLVKECFQKLVDKDHCVLELGAGYGDFINCIKARKKIAIDIWPGTKKYLNNEIEFINTSLSNLSEINENSIDLVLASNVFEHLTHEELKQCLDQFNKQNEKKWINCNIATKFQICIQKLF